MVSILSGEDNDILYNDPDASTEDDSESGYTNDSGVYKAVEEGDPLSDDDVLSGDSVFMP